MAKSKTPEHRRVILGRLTPYEGREHRCARDVLCWLLFGPESTRTGLRHCRPSGLAAELGWSVANITAALAMLHTDGVILWAPEVRTVLCLDGLACAAPSNDDHATSLRREVDRFHPSACRTKAIEIINSHRNTVSYTNQDTLSDIRGQGAGEQVKPTVYAAVAGVPSLQPALAQSTENSSTPATQSNPPAEQLALTLPEVKAPKVKKPPNPRAMLARAVWLEWNSRAETTLGWAPSSTFDGAILTVLGKASEYYGHENLLVLLDYAQTDLWYSADPSKRAGPWGILHFFASQNLDKLYAACRRAEHGAAA